MLQTQNHLYSFVLGILFLSNYLTAQDTITVRYYLDSCIGIDASIAQHVDFKDTNKGNTPYLRASGWTRNGSSTNNWRALIDLPMIPNELGNFEITNATLRLFYPTEYEDISTHGGRYGDNPFEVFRIIEPWDEMQVIWDNQPAYDTTFSIHFPRSNDHDSSDLDLTPLVLQSLDQAGSSFGYLFKILEVPLRNRIYASSDHDTVRWKPILFVTYIGDTCNTSGQIVDFKKGPGENNCAELYNNCVTCDQTNIGVGMRALLKNVGYRNTSLGVMAGLNNKGSGNVFLGYQVGMNGDFSNQLHIGNNPDSLLVFGDFSTGQLAIGTMDLSDLEDYKLTVKGKVKAKELTVMPQTWPDYVFDPGYQLIKLKDLDSFIQEYHHLPGVPSSHEVIEQGVDSGNMHAILLEKIEELTLHIIAQQKEIDHLKKELKK